MRVPASKGEQNPDNKLVIEIVAAFKLNGCLIAVSPPSDKTLKRQQRDPAHSCLYLTYLAGSHNVQRFYHMSVI